MKLFRQLLVAPTTLIMLAPIAGNATETNLREVSNYSDEVIEITSKSFENNSTNTPLLAGGEGLTDSHDHSDGPDSFSETTVATQTAQMLLSGASGEPSYLDQEAAQFFYYYGMSLDTSFDGEDNLNVVIETGNSAGAGVHTVSKDLDFGSDNGDVLKVVDLNYTKSFGDLSVTVGDSLDASSQYPGACAYSGFTDHLSDCGTGLSAGLGGDVSLSSSYDIGNGFVAGFGLTGNAAGNTTSGLFTKESIDAFGSQLAYTQDSYGVAVSYASIDSPVDGTDFIGVAQDTNVYGINAYYNFDGPIQSLSAGYEVADVDSGILKNTTNWFAGLETAEFGPGSISLGVGSRAHQDEDAEDLMLYEVSYSWDVNDGIDMTLGGYIKEQPGTAEDFTGVALTSTFSF
jgi:hypothetical protein